MAIKNAELGIDAAKRMPENDEKNSNLRAIFYNGLASCGYLRLAQGTLDDDLRMRVHYYREQQKRLDTDGSDEKELREEEWGGALLLREIEAYPSNVIPREISSTAERPHPRASTRHAESGTPIEAIASFTSAQVVEPRDGNKEIT